MQLVLGIGAEKAGTSWLGQYFESHSDVGFSPVKELHFFDQLFLPQYKERLDKRFQGLYQKTTGLEKKHVGARLEIGQSVEKYRAFMQELGNNKKCVADITPFYAELTAEHWLTINSLFSSVKVIFILRNPVDRVWSHLKMVERIRNGKVDAKQLIDTFEKNIEIVFRTEYYKTLQELHKSVPQKDLFLAFYEDIFGENGQVEIDRLCDFMSIDRCKANFQQVVNSGSNKSINQSERDKIFAKTKYIYQELLKWNDKHDKLQWPQNWLSDFKNL